MYATILHGFKYLRERGILVYNAVVMQGFVIWGSSFLKFRLVGVHLYKFPGFRV